MAAQLVGQEFGEPPFLVVEPPNACRFKPNNPTPTTTIPNAIWKTLFDTKMKDKECDVTGFPQLLFLMPGVLHCSGGPHA